MVIRRFHSFRTGQFAGKRLGVVDEHRQVLWTDRELLILIFECDQRNFFRRAIARDTLRFIHIIARHNHLCYSLFTVYYSLFTIHYSRLLADLSAAFFGGSLSVGGIHPLVFSMPRSLNPFSNSLNATSSSARS